MKKKSVKGPFFENLKNINPKYNSNGNDSTTDRNNQYYSKWDTFIVDNKDKLSVWKEATDDLRLESNKEDDLKIEDSNDDLKNWIPLTNDSNGSPSPTDRTVPGDNVPNVTSYTDTDTYNDDIVIFERLSCSNLQTEKVKKAPKSITTKKLLIALGITFIISLMIWSMIRLNVEYTFLNYFNVKVKRKPTNYEVSLLFIKNVCRLFSSGIENFIIW